MEPERLRTLVEATLARFGEMSTPYPESLPQNQYSLIVLLTALRTYAKTEPTMDFQQALSLSFSMYRELVEFVEGGGLGEEKPDT